MDHSAFDSTAFLIEAEGKKILYSGDLRLHGRKPGMAKRLIQAARKQGIDLLLMEGTQFSGDHRAGPSGHIFAADIVEFVQAINPRTVVPIHTFAPETFRQHLANVMCLQDGVPFCLG